MHRSDTEDLDSFVSEKTVARVLETPEVSGFKTEILDPLWFSET
jgi:hypothetical protein